jgi:hypothetical protein
MSPLQQPFLLKKNHPQMTNDPQEVAAPCLQEHVDDGSQAIGGAGGVGHHVVVGLVVLRVVHPDNLRENGNQPG